MSASIELLALRVATGGLPEDEVAPAVSELLAHGYRFWVCPHGPQLHRVLKYVPTSRCHVHGSELIEVHHDSVIIGYALCRVREDMMCSAWAIERDGGRINTTEHVDRDEALRAAWDNAISTGAVVGKQLLATMQRPPKGYAIVLVAGSSKLPHRFTHEV